MPCLPPKRVAHDEPTQNLVDVVARAIDAVGRNLDEPRLTAGIADEVQTKIRRAGADVGHEHEPVAVREFFVAGAYRGERLRDPFDVEVERQVTRGDLQRDARELLGFAEREAVGPYAPDVAREQGCAGQVGAQKLDPCLAMGLLPSSESRSAAVRRC